MQPRLHTGRCSDFDTAHPEPNNDTRPWCPGRRHFPEDLPESLRSTAERPESFGMRSAQDMYKEFPVLVRSSYPLYVRSAGPQVCCSPLVIPPCATQ